MVTEQQWRLILPLSYLDPHKAKRSRLCQEIDGVTSICGQEPQNHHSR